MVVIERSASTNRGVYSVDVKYFDWKVFLTGFFKAPTSFRFSKYHVLTFRSEEPGYLKVKRFEARLTSLNIFCLREA